MTPVENVRVLRTHSRMCDDVARYLEAETRKATDQQEANADLLAARRCRLLGAKLMTEANIEEAKIVAVSPRWSDTGHCVACNVGAGPGYTGCKLPRGHNGGHSA